MQNHLVSQTFFKAGFIHISMMFAFLFASTAFAQGVSTQPAITGFDTYLNSAPDQARGMAFLPDNRLLFTDRSGALRILDKDYKKSEYLKGSPNSLAPENGGTLDVAVDPDYRSNNYVYFSFSETGEDLERSAAIGRAELIDNEIRNFEVIYRQEKPTEGTALHHGRLLFTPAGRLLFATGDLVIFDPAQSSGPGQNILRVDLESTLSDSNSFADTERRERRDLMIWEPGNY